MTRGRAWTAEQDAWVAARYPGGQRRELEEGFLSEFGFARTANSIKQRARKLGVGKAEGFSREMPRRFWTPEKDRWFAGFVPGHSDAEISAEHERLYGTPLTESQIGNHKRKLGVRSGTHGGRFEKGMEPANKGRTWDEQGIPPEVQERMRATCFKPGEVHDRPDGWIKPVGHERVNRDGYVEVKVRDSRSDGLQRREPGHFNENYRLKHVVAWEEANGRPVPPSTMVVFADHDKRNFDPANLVAVPRALWARICQSGAQYYDRESLEACMAIAALQNAVGEAGRAPRACGACGEVFEPRYARQRTCDACLDAGRRAPRKPGRKPA